MSLRHIILLTLGCTVIGCSRLEQPHHPLLLQAERLVDEHPDSAFSFIYNLQESFGSTADSCLYRLLYTEILHKKGIFIGNDSAIAACERYYRNNGKGRRWAKALLHLGITTARTGNPKEAVRLLKQAELMGKELDDTLQFDVAIALGDFNKQEHCRDLMTSHYLKALQIAKSMESPKRHALSLVRIIRAEKTGDSSQEIAACRRLLKEVDKPLQSELLACIGNWELEHKQTDSARIHLQAALDTFPNDYAALQLGNVYEHEGNPGQACEHWFEALNTNNDEIRIAAFRKLIPCYEQSETWRALDLSKQLNSLLEKRHFTGQTESMAEQQATFDHEVVKGRLLRRLTYTMAAIGILACICLVLFVRYKHKQNDYDKVIGRIHELQEQLASRPERPKDWNLRGALLENDIVHRFHLLAIKGRTPTLEDWKELHGIVDKHVPEFSLSIHQNGLLSERDTHICILIKLRFLPSEIATLIGASPQTITNSRTRLLGKIFNEHGGARDFDERIRKI